VSDGVPSPMSQSDVTVSPSGSLAAAVIANAVNVATPKFGAAPMPEIVGARLGVGVGVGRPSTVQVSSLAVENQGHGLCP